MPRSKIDETEGPMRKPKPLAIPAGASEQIKERWENGQKKSAFYLVRGEKIAFKYWEADGTLTLEYGMKGDTMHGPFRTWHDNKMLCEETHYIAGKEHGSARQYDGTGNLIGTYKMHHGTGIDLWYDAKGILSEERHCKDGHRHGYERWWNRGNQTVWKESHFKQALEHGIFREWNNSGKLCRGYPKYFVDGEKVTKRQYLRACRIDPTLPKFYGAENKPIRKWIASEFSRQI